MYAYPHLPSTHNKADGNDGFLVGIMEKNANYYCGFLQGSGMMVMMMRIMIGTTIIPFNLTVAIQAFIISIWLRLPNTLA